MLRIVSGTALKLEASSERLREHVKSHALLVVTEGSAFVNKEVLNVGEGFLLYENSNVSVKSAKGKNAFVIYIALDGEDTENLLPLSDADKPLKLTVPDTKRLTDIAKLFLDGGYTCVSHMLDEALAKLFISLVNFEQSREYTPAYSNVYIDKAVRYINENYSSDLRVEGIASVLGIDRMYLRNLFVEHVGMPTMEFIMNVRMTKAKELLADSSLSVSAVAASVGYRDVLAFSKAFKKHVGTAPTAFRKESVKPTAQSRDIPIFIL